MADATARFDLEVNTDASSAGPAASALETLAAKIKEDQKALGELQKAMKNLQGGTNVGIEAFKQLQAQIDAKKSGLAASSESYLALGGNLGQMATKAKGSAEAVAKARQKVEEAQMAEVKKLQEANLKRHDEDASARVALEKKAGDELKKVNAASINGMTEAAFQAGTAQQAIAAAVVAIVAAIAVAVVVLARFALAAADAARSAGILREAATGSAGAASRLDKEISILASRVPTARAELERLANELARSGLSGNALETALSAIATTSAVMGSAAGSALQGIVDRARMSKRFLLSAFDLQGTGLKIQDVGAAVAKRLGISVQAAIAALQNGQIKLADGLAGLDDAVQAKFGAAAAKQMLAFPTQIAKAKENLDRLFVGVKIEKFLGALHEVLSLLDENTASGRALKAIFESLLNPIFEAIGARGGLARAFFQGMIIIALQFAIGVMKVKKALSEAFGGSTAGISNFQVAMTVGKVAAVALGAVLGALTILFGLLAAAVFLVALPFIIFGAAVVAVGYGIYQLGSWISGMLGKVAAIGPTMGSSLGEVLTTIANFVTDAVMYLGNLPIRALEAAGNFVLGLVQGIMTGKGPVADAVKSLASSAVGAITTALGIHSPSRVMAKLGTYTSEGFAEGVEAGAPDVKATMEATVEPPAPGGKGRGQAVGGRQFVFNGDFFFGDRKATKDKALEDEMAMVFERALARAGAGA